MKKILFIFVATTLVIQSGTAGKKYKNDAPAYVIYNNEGKQVMYSEMLEQIQEYDVLLFGEMHNDPISHWMELKLTKDLYETKGDALIMGAEMWEADNQLIMDEMMVDRLVDGKSYTEASKLWPNFETDYKPFLQFAKDHYIPFICTNIPRRYARIVYQKGEVYLDCLSVQSKSYISPLPIHWDLEQPAYAKMLSLFPPDTTANNKTAHGGPMGSYQGENLVKAQAIKDATMAHFILKNWQKGKYFLHINGCYHSNDYQGIYFYLKHYNPELKIGIISVSWQENPLPFNDENNHGDFNIIVPDDMTKTYNSL